MPSINNFSDISKLFPDQITMSSMIHRNAEEKQAENSLLSYSRGDILSVPNEMWGFTNDSSLDHPGIFWDQNHHAALLSQGTDWKNIDCRQISKYFSLDPTHSNKLSKRTGFRRNLESISIKLFGTFIPNVRGKLDAWDLRTAQEQIVKCNGE